MIDSAGRKKEETLPSRSIHICYKLVCLKAPCLVPSHCSQCSTIKSSNLSYCFINSCIVTLSSACRSAPRLSYWALLSYYLTAILACVNRNQQVLLEKVRLCFKTTSFHWLCFYNKHTIFQFWTSVTVQHGGGSVEVGLLLILYLKLHVDSGLQIMK